MSTRSGGAAQLRRPGAPRRGRGRQRGLTLIEMLVTLALIAVAVVGIAYGFSAVVRGSGTAQQQASLDTAARTVASYLQSSTLPYSPCATSSTYGLPAPPAQITWSVTDVRLSIPGSLQRPSASPATANASSTAPIATCPGNVDDYGVQEITVQVCTPSRCLNQAIWKGAT
jgi:prepilin-type N-terminal cleavage/methylation domain-containing protein